MPNSVNKLASHFSNLSLKPPSTRNSLVNLPPDVLDLISRTPTLSTRNIGAMRRAHRNLTRNVAPRNTSKAASTIAAHGRGMANRKYIKRSNFDKEYWVRRAIHFQQLRDHFEQLRDYYAEQLRDYLGRDV